MRTFKIWSLCNVHIYTYWIYFTYILKYSYHAVHFIPMIYLSYNWKFIPFDHLQPFPHSPLPASVAISVFSVSMNSAFFPSLKGIFLLLSEREKGKEEERERQTSISCPCEHAPTGDWTPNLGICPDWELNPRLLVYRTTLQPTESHGPSSGVFFRFHI